MKTQKRKIKEKNKSQEDKPPFFDVSCLKSRTVQVSEKYESKEVILEEWGLSNSSFDRSNCTELVNTEQAVKRVIRQAKSKAARA